MTGPEAYTLALRVATDFSVTQESLAQVLARGSGAEVKISPDGAKGVNLWEAVGDPGTLATGVVQLLEPDGRLSKVGQTGECSRLGAATLARLTEGPIDPPEGMDSVQAMLLGRLASSARSEKVFTGAFMSCSFQVPVEDKALEAILAQVGMDYAEARLSDKGILSLVRGKDGVILHSFATIEKVEGVPVLLIGFTAASPAAGR